MILWLESIVSLYFDLSIAQFAHWMLCLLTVTAALFMLFEIESAAAFRLKVFANRKLSSAGKAECDQSLQTTRGDQAQG